MKSAYLSITAWALVLSGPIAFAEVDEAAIVDSITWRIDHLYYENVLDFAHFKAQVEAGYYPFSLVNGRAVIRADLHGAWHYDPGLKRLVQTLTPAEIASSSIDTHAVSFSFAQNIKLSDCDIYAGPATEALKASLCYNLVVEDCRLYGGEEDASDMVRGKNYFFNNVLFYTLGTQAMSVKGSVEGVFVVNSHYAGKPEDLASTCSRSLLGHYVEIGNWSDYNIFERPKTRDAFIFATFERRVNNFLGCRTGTNQVKYWEDFAEEPVTNGHLYDAADGLLGLAEAIWNDVNNQTLEEVKAKDRPLWPDLNEAEFEEEFDALFSLDLDPTNPLRLNYDLLGPPLSGWGNHDFFGMMWFASRQWAYLPYHGWLFFPDAEGVLRRLASNLSWIWDESQRSWILVIGGYAENTAVYWRHSDQTWLFGGLDGVVRN